ncbi:MAG TPA: glycosyltransferase family 2 protein [Candidatus Saccharimonadales bacterium]|nr:glycosyltransferase family 2 protein [Candidatus Saccharimonadales bacterium]
MRGPSNLLERLTPFFSLILLTTPLWLSFFLPAFTVYLIFIFDLYFVYRSSFLAINSVRSYLKIKESAQTNWLEKARSENLSYQKVHHLVFIPTYKEPYTILERTLSFLAASEFPSKNIIIVLAGEEREEGFLEKAEELKKNFAKFFYQILVTRHILKEGEVAGKSSNQNYAASLVSFFIEQEGFDEDFLTITSCDADVAIHPKYFSNLAYLFLKSPEPYKRFWQGALVFYNNIWRVPLPVRVVHTLFSVAGVADLMRSKTSFIYSTYSASWKMIKEAGFWDPDVISEDWHLFFKTFFATKGQVELEPIFLASSADAVEGNGYLNSLSAQYQQNRRWAWGVVDVGYALKKFREHYREISIPNFIIRLLRALEQHLLWPVNWWFITLGATLPPLINPNLRYTTLGYYLPKLSGIILTISTLFILVIIVIDILLRPPKPEGAKKSFFLVSILQYLLLPITGFVFGSLPGMDAHARLLFGKRLDYKVTEKFEKK